MTRFFIITALWIGLAVIGLAGLTSGQPALMTFCFLLWTPAAVLFGWSFKAAGVRIAFTPAEPPAERKPSPAAPVQSINTPMQQRQRRIQ